MDSTTKRRRIERSPSPVYKLDEDDDSYKPYVPVAQRRQEKLAKYSSLGVNAERQKAKRLQEEQEEREDALKEEERLREKARKERTLLLEAQEVQRRKAAEGVLGPCCERLFYSFLQMQRKPKERRRKRLIRRFWRQSRVGESSCLIWNLPREYSIPIH